MRTLCVLCLMFSLLAACHSNRQRALPASTDGIEVGNGRQPGSGQKHYISPHHYELKYDPRLTLEEERSGFEVTIHDADLRPDAILISSLRIEIKTGLDNPYRGFPSYAEKLKRLSQSLETASNRERISTIQFPGASGFRVTQNVVYFREKGNRQGTEEEYHLFTLYDQYFVIHVSYRNRPERLFHSILESLKFSIW